MKKLTICLLGKQGAGKSASGNTLLGSQTFYSTANSQRVTQACSMSFSFVDELKIKVIDTPGWCISPQFETEMKPKIIEYINECKPHVFLLVLPIGRFTNEEIDTVLNIFKAFGDEFQKYMTVLFTKGDDLEKKTFEDYMKELQPHLSSVIQICEEKYHVFSNKNKDQEQVSSLLRKLKEMVEKNDEKRYTKATYKEAKQPRNEAENSVPEKITNAAVKEKQNDHQVANVDGKEETKEETLDDRKHKMLLQNLNQLIENTENGLKFFQDISKQHNDIQGLEGELKEILEKLKKVKDQVLLSCQKAQNNKQLQTECKKYQS